MTAARHALEWPQASPRVMFTLKYVSLVKNSVSRVSLEYRVLSIQESSTLCTCECDVACEQYCRPREVALHSSTDSPLFTLN